MEAIKSIFYSLSPRKKNAPIFDHNPAGNEVMPKPQTPQAANAANTTAHSPGIADEGNIQPAISNGKIISFL